MSSRPAQSDSLLFVDLAKKTYEALKLYRDLQEGQFSGPAEVLEEIQGLVDTPMLDSILKLAIEEVDQSLLHAGVLAEKHGLDGLLSRIRQIREGKQC